MNRRLTAFLALAGVPAIVVVLSLAGVERPASMSIAVLYLLVVVLLFPFERQDRVVNVASILTGRRLAVTRKGRESIELASGDAELRKSLLGIDVVLAVAAVVLILGFVTLPESWRFPVLVPIVLGALVFVLSKGLPDIDD